MTTLSEDALILAPLGRDAEIAGGMLAEKGFASRACADLQELIDGLVAGAGFAIVTEEAVATANLHGLSAWLAAQGEWSDFPFILLTRRGGGLERNPAAGRYLETIGNVTFLERPFHPTTLISVARAALRARRRQYDARSRLENIREAEERLTVALAAGGLGTWSLELRSYALETSPDCKAHYGIAPHEPFDFAAFMAVVHPDDVERVKEEMRQSSRTGADYLCEYRCIWPDRSVHWVQVRGRVERDVSGQANRMVGVSQDVTERRDNVEALRRLAADLEQRVEQRTREHEQVSAQLHEARKLETIGQLTGGVAHDFNNLLTPIMGTLDLLKRKIGPHNAQYAEWLDNALQSAERARTLVKRLLGFARRAELQVMPVDIAALVEGMRDLVRSSVGSTIELTIRSEPDLPPAFADPQQLELALLNLCVNARDAMPEGGQLTIGVKTGDAAELSSDADDPGFVVVSVTDTGSGMDAETVQRAVEPFFSTKEVGRGTGLGLSMVHGLAAQLGGTFDLRSEEGKGTTASLSLRASTEPVARAPQPDSFAAPAESAPMDILLVDDEPLVRMGTAEMLRDLGHRVTEAAGGRQALDQLGAGLAPDILVTDYKMPGMDGAQLSREVRAIDPRMKILLVTGYTGSADEGTANARLAKPFGQAEIAAAIAGLMGEVADVV